jgi:hypothetical protein
MGTLQLVVLIIARGKSGPDRKRKGLGDRLRILYFEFGVCPQIPSASGLAPTFQSPFIRLLLFRCRKRQVVREKRQDLHLDTFGDAIRVIAFIGFERVGDVEHLEAVVKLSV